jgi:hypothetical protein
LRFFLNINTPPSFIYNSGFKKKKITPQALFINSGFKKKKINSTSFIYKFRVFNKKKKIMVPHKENFPGSVNRGSA